MFTRYDGGCCFGMSVVIYGRINTDRQLVMLNDSEYSRLLSDTQSFLSKCYDLFRVRLLEKVSRILGLLIAVVVVLFLSSIIVIFGGISLAYVLAQWLPLWAAYLIMGGVFVLLVVLAIVFRKQLFINPIVAALASILFANDKPLFSGEDNDLERKEVEDDRL